jgi:DNA polymerase-4
VSQQAARRRVTDDIDAVDDTRCTILHVDMDAFFAAVELRRRPDLAGRPMMVAGTGGRGVVLSATYEARAYGVRSAMPTAQALARCPRIVVIPPDHDAYRDASDTVMTLFDTITPIVEPLSVDEAFLDVSGARRTGGSPARIATTIRRRIRDELGLTATVGAASTKFVAKLASGLAKPDGLLVVPPDDVAGLLRPLPVSALWGVGPQTATRLASLGFVTVGEIADTDPAALGRSIGVALATKLHLLARGVDDRAVTTHTAEASIGAETTFAVDVRDDAAVRRTLLELAAKAARRTRRAGYAGRTVVLKVRFDDFTTVNRSEALAIATCEDREVYLSALRSWERLASGRRPVRLLGVRLEGLLPAAAASQQLEFDLHQDRPEWSRAQHALDAIADRFPAAAPRPAALLPPPRPESPHPGPAPADPDAASPRGAPASPRVRFHGQEAPRRLER